METEAALDRTTERQVDGLALLGLQWLHAKLMAYDETSEKAVSFHKQSEKACMCF